MLDVFQLKISLAARKQFQQENPSTVYKERSREKANFCIKPSELQ